MKKKNFYAVKTGRHPEIYTSWDDCLKEVKGFSGAVYKKFSTMPEAENFLHEKDDKKIETTDDYAFVDGSYNVESEVFGYGGFLIHNGEKHILQGSGTDPSLSSMRNVAGELLGCMEAVDLALHLQMKELTIYYDYNGIEMFATDQMNRWNANKLGTIAYQNYMTSVRDQITIHFQYVKGHSGIPGNEEADRLAKEAAGIM